MSNKLKEAHGSVEETNKQNSHLIKYEEVKNTPFQTVRVENEDDTVEYYVMFGKYRISEKMKSEEEAKKEAKTIDWWKIMSVCHAIAEQVVEAKELKTK